MNVRRCVKVEGAVLKKQQVQIAHHVLLLMVIATRVILQCIFLAGMTLIANFALPLQQANCHRRNSQIQQSGQILARDNAQNQQETSSKRAMQQP